jgi:hypothetical protein
MQRCWSTFLLAAKGMADSPLSANEEIAAALRGKGRVQLPFIPDGHPALDAAGRLVDRRGQPLHFHREGPASFTIRSAGADAVLFTEDDDVRTASGETRSGL